MNFKYSIYYNKDTNPVNQEFYFSDIDFDESQKIFREIQKFNEILETMNKTQEILEKIEILEKNIEGLKFKHIFGSNTMFGSIPKSENINITMDGVKVC